MKGTLTDTGLTKWLQVGVLSVLAITGILTTYFRVNENRLFFYPTVFVFLGISTSLVSWKLRDKEGIPLHRLDPRLLDISITIGIVVSVIISRLQPVGLPSSYYVIVIVVALLLALRVLKHPSPIALGEILLFGLVVRSAFWYAAPVIGRDARLHLGIVRYMVQTGNLIPVDVVYYHWYPVAHTVTSALTLLTGLSYKVSQFWTISVPSVLLLSLLLGITRQIINGREEAYQVGLLAILFVVINPRHITRTGEPVPQSLAMTFLIVALFMFLQRKDWRRTFLLFATTLVLAATHNLTPLLLIAMVGLLYSGNRIGRWILKSAPSNPNITYRPIVVVVGLIATIQYYIVASYFSLQVSRIIGILSLGGGISQDVQTSFIAGNAQIGLFDPLLHLGVDLFVYIFAVVFVFVLKLLQWPSSSRTQLNTVWYGVAVCLVGIVGVSMVISGSENVARALGAVSLVMGPVLAYVVLVNSKHRFGIILAAILVITFPLLTAVAADNGLRNPGMAPTERGADDVQIHLTNEEVAAVNFVAQQEWMVYSDGYLASYAAVRSLQNGWKGPEGLHGPIKSSGEMAQLSRNNISSIEEPVLYRHHVEDRTGTVYPQSCSVFYDSGQAEIIRCP